MTRMTDHLRDARILVLEDDYYLAADLQEALEAASATVIGPFADETDASRALADGQPDFALLDLNLGKGPSFDLPRSLIRLSVPFAFVTGYDDSFIPGEFAGVERFEKPVEPGKVIEAVADRLRRRH